MFTKRYYLRDLHVVTELEVRREEQSLSHGDVTPGFEHHHRNRATGEGITDDKLGYNVETDLLVSDGLDDADRNNVDEGNDL